MRQQVLLERLAADMGGEREGRSGLYPAHPMDTAACTHSPAPTKWSPTVPDNPTNKASHNECTPREPNRTVSVPAATRFGMRLIVDRGVAIVVEQTGLSAGRQWPA